MNAYLLIATLIIFWCGFREVGGMCTPHCFGKPIMDEPAVCDKQNGRKKYFYAYYDPKLDKCLSSYCIKNRGDVFEEVEQCTAECQDCQRLLKHYKPEDECLKAIRLQSVNPEGSKATPNPRFLWEFDTISGKCVESDFDQILSEDMKKGWRITQGIALPSQSECEKRCPTIK